MKFEFLSELNADRYIEYLKKAFYDEPDMMTGDCIDEIGIKERVGDPFYKNTKSLLAFDGENVIGRIEYHFYGCLQDGYKMAYVDWVYVLKVYRCNGVARELFREFEKDCRENGINQYYLIRATNEYSDKFYKSFDCVALNDAPILRKTIIALPKKDKGE